MLDIPEINMISYSQLTDIDLSHFILNSDFDITLSSSTFIEAKDPLTHHASPTLSNTSEPPSPTQIPEGNPLVLVRPSIETPEVETCT